MYISSRAIYLSFAMALVYCLAYIFLMSKFGHYIAWFVVILIQLALIATSAAFFYIYVNVASLRIIQSYQDTTALALGILFSILSLVYMVLLCCGYAQLKVAIGIMDASADFLQKTKTILLVPLGFFFVEVFIFALWLICFGCIQAIGTLEADAGGPVPQMKKIDNTPEERRKLDYINAFMVFGIIWIGKFIEHKTCMITMISASTYYFNSNTEVDGEAEVGLAFQFAYLKHAGSIACGSFIITCVHCLRFMILPIAERCSRATGDSALVKFLVCFGTCCMNWIESICDYINKVAYSYIAVSGESFCTSAWHGFLLNMKHALEFTWANFLARVFIFMGKIGLVFLNCYSLWYIMEYIFEDTVQVRSIFGPMAIVAAFTYMCASIFLGVFDEVVLALLTCMCIDIELNLKPKYGPPQFHALIDSFFVELDEEQKDFYRKRRIRDFKGV